MTNIENAERLEEYYRTHKQRKNKVNVCNGRANWNVCDYGDVTTNFCEYGRKCWKQDGKHNCIRCVEIDV